MRVYDIIMSNFDEICHVVWVSQAALGNVCQPHHLRHKEKI